MGAKTLSFIENQGYNRLHLLIKEKTRILRPWEYKQLCEVVPKKDFKTMLNALLFTGMRYVEMQ